jgi:hypothetical protein
MQIWIRDLFNPGYGMEKVGSGINLPDPQHWKKPTLNWSNIVLFIVLTKSRIEIINADI